VTIAVAGASSRDSRRSHTGIRAALAPLVDSHGVLLSEVEEMKAWGVKLGELRKGFLWLASDGNVTYIGPPGRTGNIPRWARLAAEAAEELGAVRFNEKFDLSLPTRMEVKTVEELASMLEVVNLCAGASATSGTRRIRPGFAGMLPGDLIGTTACWNWKPGRTEPPILLITDGQVTIKWATTGHPTQLERMKARRKAIYNAPAGWVWKEVNE